MKNVLLIGGEGYIGNIVSQKLLINGYHIISYDNLIYHNHICVLNKNHFDKYNFVFGDMLEKDKLEKLIGEVDCVVLLAGLVGDPITKKYPDESAMINDNGVKNVIDLCSKKNVERFVFISTCSNYGLIKDDVLADEEYELNPLSLYSKSKVNAEKYILSLQGNTDMNPTILRFATAFGLSPRMRFDLTISEFTYQLALGNELVVYDADTWRPYCHVEDFACLIQKVIESPIEKVSFEVFNAGSDVNNATKKMIVDMIISEIPYGKVKYQDHGSDPRNYRVNFDKVRSTLDFEAKKTIKDGINELLEKINQHVFHNINDNINFFGNYEIKIK
jgi:nucleoside-diphosphate-sugar epimerase